jgi:hypothetical protein
MTAWRTGSPHGLGSSVVSLVSSVVSVVSVPGSPLLELVLSASPLLELVLDSLLVSSTLMVVSGSTVVSVSVVPGVAGVELVVSAVSVRVGAVVESVSASVSPELLMPEVGPVVTWVSLSLFEPAVESVKLTELWVASAPVSVSVSVSTGVRPQADASARATVADKENSTFMGPMLDRRGGGVNGGSG